MANTFHSINIHYVFSTKNRDPVITPQIREHLWPYIGGIARHNKMKALCVGGTADHIHALVSLPTTLSIAKAVQWLKGVSSKFVHETFPTHKAFAWQDGYGAFSLSKSHIPDTIDYIKNQVEHHRKRTFQEEYIAFLKRHAIEYDEKYVWG